jgi:hypothetical protein
MIGQGLGGQILHYHRVGYLAIAANLVAIFISRRLRVVS